MRYPRRDLVGKRFGMLLIKSFAGYNKRYRSLWNCTCDCGREVVRIGINLEMVPGLHSCGCWNQKRSALQLTSHGFSKPSQKCRAYKSWVSMRRRCNSPGDKDYPRYGGRGIKICDRWNSFELFMQDMGERPAGTTLGRIDNDGPYSPENCRWETPVQQINNTSVNVFLTHEGRTQTIAQWAKEIGMRHDTLCRRIFTRNWAVGRALTEPLVHNRRRGKPQ